MTTADVCSLTVYDAMVVVRTSEKAEKVWSVEKVADPLTAWKLLLDVATIGGIHNAIKSLNEVDTSSLCAVTPLRAVSSAARVKAQHGHQELPATTLEEYATGLGALAGCEDLDDQLRLLIDKAREKGIDLVVSLTTFTNQTGLRELHPLSRLRLF